MQACAVLLVSRGHISPQQCISQPQSQTLKFQITFKKYMMCNIHFIFSFKDSPLPPAKKNWMVVLLKDKMIFQQEHKI